MIVNGVQVTVDGRLPWRLVSKGDDIIARLSFQDLCYAASYRKDFIKVKAVGQCFVVVKGGGQVVRADKYIGSDQWSGAGAEAAKKAVNKQA